MDVVSGYWQTLVSYIEIGAQYNWVIHVFAVVLATLFANYFMRKLFDRWAEKAKQTSTYFDDMLIYTARKPVRVFVWVEGILLAASIVRRVSNEPIFDVIDPIREVSFIVILAWFAVRLVRQFEKAVQWPDFLEKPMDPTTASALGKLLRLSVIITTSLVVLQSLGFSVSGILAFGGIGGIAVGFAAKDLLSNFFGGLMIYMDQPFRVGDWIRSPDQEIEGTVEHIGWRLTCIRTFDKRPLYVPNATFASISVENPSRMTNRRIYEAIGVRYDDAAKVEAIVKDVKAMLLQHKDIDTNQTLIVNINAFAASSIDFFIYTFTKTTNWIEYHEIKQDVMLKVIDIIQRHGAEFAFPTQTVHLKQDAQIPIGPAE
ncbi:mechanosensitive ion channel family protein [Reinekea thalattae]|uniref:Mechanosensitive ion channel family protein n=1 Tax=Reinekea thalattae TaxID=2593301 RepID=A0A5C8Z5A5_9GAMM|nr:mechanosensitive ion channel family protein [Reinekea thalattae]TXR52100.1 mechanosensitive ion channel family protein [Reinekea thalattae]